MHHIVHTEMYRLQQVGIKLTTLTLMAYTMWVYKCICKANYHTTMAMTSPHSVIFTQLGEQLQQVIEKDKLFINLPNLQNF
jgi:thiaminase